MFGRKSKAQETFREVLDNKYPWSYLSRYPHRWNSLLFNDFVLLLSREEGLEDIPLTFADLHKAFEYALHDPNALTGGLARVMRERLADRERDRGNTRTRKVIE